MADHQVSFFGTSTAGGPFGDWPNKGDHIKVTDPGFQGISAEYVIIDEAFTFDAKTGLWSATARPVESEDGVIEVTLDMLYRCACGAAEAVHNANGELLSELFRVNPNPCGPVDWEVNE